MKKQELMPNLPMSRRVFNKLSVAGALTLASPFNNIYAQTGSKGVAKRFVAFVQPGGLWHGKWAAGGANGIQFGYGVKPLEKFRDQIVAFKGLNNIAARNTRHHYRGMASLLTGHDQNNADLKRTSRDRSIDQMIADKIGAGSPFKSVEVGFKTLDSVGSQTRMVYSAPGTAKQPIGKPQALFDKLFKGRSFDTDNNAEIPSEEFDKLSLRREHVLDLIKSQITMMERELVGDDKARMQRHMETVVDLERRIQSGGGAMASAGCEVPKVPGQMDAVVEAEVQADLLAQSLVCGLTNVATWQSNKAASTETWQFVPEWAKTYPGRKHHGVTHRERMNTEPEAMAFAGLDAFHARLIARVCEQLDSVAEDGGTMLDNTIMLWLSPLSTPKSHSHNNMHWMMLGGKGLGRWKTDRFVDGQGEKAHNLHISVMDAFDLGVKSIGNKNAGTGPLSVL